MKETEKEKNQENRNEKEYPFQLVGLGGCFDHLHKGHHLLIKTAFKLGKKVAIALTTEPLHKDKAFHDKIQPYEIRKRQLERYIEQEIHRSSEDYTIIPLSDPFGPAITDTQLEAHVSSMETYPVAMKINEIRQKRGLPLLILVIIPLVLNEKGEKISSTEIRKQLQEENQQS